MSRKPIFLKIFIILEFLIYFIFLIPLNFILAITPSDSNFNEQWYLKKIKATNAWDKVNESPDVVIAVIDSGVDINNPDLKDNIWINEKEIPNNKIDDDKNGYIDDVNGWDFVNNSNEPTPKFAPDFTDSGIQHGTIIAGIIAAEGNNNKGISGITWKAKIMPLKVLDDNGGGNIDNVIKATQYAINNGADIINYSFVGFGYNKKMEEMIQAAYKRGIVIVAAAGNDQSQGKGYNLDETPLYPACYDGKSGENMVIGVTATDALDQKTSFSSYGTSCTDIAAPGTSIYSTAYYKPNKYYNGVAFDKVYDGYWSGTSMATPQVTGAIALIEAINPGLNRDEIIDIIKNSADNIDNLNPQYIFRLGSGRLNVYNSILNAQLPLLLKKVNLIITPFNNYGGRVKIINRNGILQNEFSILDNETSGGINIASGAVTDGKENLIIIGLKSGIKPLVKIYDKKGDKINEFFAYDKNFRGGVNVAAGDINNDGIDEIITGAGPGGGPHVRIFNSKGELIRQFFAYDKNFRGGVNVAAGDINNDGIDEIITGAGPGGGPQIRIFNINLDPIGQFFAYDKNFRGGVNVAVGNMYGKSTSIEKEIITSTGAGNEPMVKIFNKYGKILNQFLAYKNNFLGGITITTADIDNDGLDEIITGAGPGGAPHLRIFERNGKVIESFYAFDESNNNGLNVAKIENN